MFIQQKLKADRKATWLLLSCLFPSRWRTKDLANWKVAGLNLTNSSDPTLLALIFLDEGAPWMIYLFSLGLYILVGTRPIFFLSCLDFLFSCLSFSSQRRPANRSGFFFFQCLVICRCINQYLRCSARRHHWWRCTGTSH